MPKTKNETEDRYTLINIINYESPLVCALHQVFGDRFECLTPLKILINAFSLKVFFSFFFEGTL